MELLSFIIDIDSTAAPSKNLSEGEPFADYCDNDGSRQLESATPTVQGTDSPFVETTVKDVNMRKLKSCLEALVDNKCTHPGSQFAYCAMWRNFAC